MQKIKGEEPADRARRAFWTHKLFEH